MTSRVGRFGEVLEPEDLGRLGPPIGNEGGQAAVLLLPEHPGHVFKRYHDGKAPSLPLMRKLARLPVPLSSDRRRALEGRAAWPCNPVVSSSDPRRLFGVVMAAIPDRFYADVAGTRLERTLELVVCSDDRMRKIPLAPPTRRQRVELALAFVDLVEFMHSLGVVMGDINYRNWLWLIDTTGPKAFAIDCDSYRLVGSSSVSASIDSPHWEDPLSGRVSSVDSDCYKLGLAIARVLAGRARGVPDPSVVASARGRLSPQLSTCLSELALTGAGERPHPDAWRTALNAELGNSSVRTRQLTTASTRRQTSTRPALSVGSHTRPRNARSGVTRPSLSLRTRPRICGSVPTPRIVPLWRRPSIRFFARLCIAGSIIGLVALFVALHG